MANRFYRYAREGITVERKAREIVIHAASLDTLSGFEMTITVRCSSGTYVRTLAEDIGKALGYGGAYLTALSVSVSVILNYPRPVIWISSNPRLLSIVRNFCVRSTVF